MSCQTETTWMPLGATCPPSPPPAAPKGIQVVSVWQDMAQITDRYGRLAATVVKNHRGKLALSGITDLGTLDYLSQLLRRHRHRPDLRHRPGRRRAVHEPLPRR